MKQNPDTKWNMLLLLSVAGLIASAYFGFYVNKSAASHGKTASHKLHDLKAETAKTQAQILATRQRIQSDIWTISLESLDSKTLDMLNQKASEHHIQLLGFLTSRPKTIGKLIQTQFKLRVEGSYMNLMTLVGELESSASKLAMDTLQITAKDGADDQVAAQIGLVGFKEAK